MPERTVDHEITVLALLNLCDLFLIELRTSGSHEVLAEVQSLVPRLLSIAKQQHSHWLLAETYMLKAMLELLELNLPEAQRLLSQAQAIADEKGLHRLAMKISSVHDNLLDQLSKWEELIDRDASLTERADLAQLEELMRRMIQKRSIELTEESSEMPVMLLILGGSGLSLFSRTFTSEGAVDDQLLGGFLAAIQSFSSQIFSQSLDRVKLEAYTLLIKAEKPFQVCYVLKGPTYLAQQKLTQFTAELRQTSAIWEALEHSQRTGMVLSDSDQNSLESLLDKFFLQNE
ncbi:MAG: hypothetical protein ACFFBD_00840 [Candidatus Hodarchaeota archaeon]